MFIHKTGPPWKEMANIPLHRKILVRLLFWLYGWALLAESIPTILTFGFVGIQLSLPILMLTLNLRYGFDPDR